MGNDYRFNIRVYAIIYNDRGELLISHEHVLGTFMTKFPGGGLEYGEGTIECLKREAMEEFGQDIEVTGHYYTTDFFQPALFFDHTQLISIYYTARLTAPHLLKTSNGTLPPDAPQGSIAFEWVCPKHIATEMMTFPIDRVVLGMIKNSIV